MSFQKKRLYILSFSLNLTDGTHSSSDNEAAKKKLKYACQYLIKQNNCNKKFYKECNMKYFKIPLILIVIVVANYFILEYLVNSRIDSFSRMSEDRVIYYYPDKTEPDNSLKISQDSVDNLTQDMSRQYFVSRRNAVTNAVSLVENSVVSINVIKTQVVRRYTNPFENPFFGFFDFYTPYRREVQSIGSGVIYTVDGYIVTNSHVVEGATQIKVILNDGRQYDADIVGLDTMHDIAVLKIDEDNLPAAEFVSSSDLIIGETVAAIGNPYGFLIKDSKPSVSVGVVSAYDRNFAENRDGKIYRRMIQTDAAINPGNSGGPLINILGEVIGLNTFIFSESGGSIGIGFAIPVDRVKNIAQEIIKYGRRRQIWFGFRIQELNPMIASYLNLSDLNGVIVSFIETNSPSERAGLRRGDIITQINDYPISNIDDAEIAISELTVGDLITFNVLRANRKIQIKMVAQEIR